jgi:transcriptional regulator with PAS, ATPase and Fis domain
VVRIQLPPLKERMHDIPLLVSRFIEEFNEKEQRSLKGITPNALQCLMSYSWPGNIRELRHVIEYAAVTSSEEVLKIRHLPESIQQQQENFYDNDMTEYTNEKDRLLKALKDANFRKQKAAALLGMHRSTFYRKLKKHGL